MRWRADTLVAAGNQAGGKEASVSALEPAVEGFGLLLRHYRTQAGLTQEALAERAGVSPRSVSGLERGEVQPHRDTAVRLVQALRLPPAQQASLLAAVQPLPRRRRVPFDRAGDASAVSPSAVTWSVGAADRIADTAAGDALPAALTSFIGRQQEQAAIARLLQGDVRLLTLTGPGGVGKTRLALAVAECLRRHMAGGVLFVPLAAVTDPQHFLATVAQAAGVSAAKLSARFAALVAVLRERALLLVLDNFEHVIAAAPDLGALLAACPKLRVLVTSRAALRIQGEQQVTVPPLELPDMQNLPTVPGLGRIPAVALFVERARAVQSEFALTAANARAVAEICTRLDGLPLAIELAASWVRLFSPQELLARLSDPLSLLNGGARDLPARQRTLRATMEWSHRLLAPEEQALFRRLAVFASGWTLEAAQEVAAADDLPAEQVLELLARLVDVSLVVVEAVPDGSVRYRLLDTLRRYAWDHLVTAGEVQQVRARHLAWSLALAERTARGARGPDQATRRAPRAAEHANLAAALAWAEEVGEIALGLRLAVALGLSWHACGYTDEERQRVEALLALAKPAAAGADPALRARGPFTADTLALRRGRH
jgi:predicted ATPase/DNA-binding XRE family transcriptional regulator